MRPLAHPPSARTVVLLLLPLLTIPMLAGCGGARERAIRLAAQQVTAADGTPAAALRLGYFAAVTHAPAVLEVADGDLARQLGHTALHPQIFNGGSAAVTALIGGSLDAAYLGPVPAINAFVQSRGRLVIVAGAVSGGAELVVKPSITSVAGLRGAQIATPQLANTQDVAARAYLAAHGLRTDTTGGGDVHLLPAASNAAILTSYRSGAIDGAWVPEPYASRLVLTDGAHVLVDERSLWPQGRFATTVLVVDKQYLLAHGTTVKALLRAQLDATAQLRTHPAAAAAAIGGALPTLGGTRLTPAVLTRALAEITPTVDPLAATLATELAHAVVAGLLPSADLHGILAPAPLDALLAAAGSPPSPTAGYQEGP